eukprot:TRINITY_DN2684_c0_g2_i2.p1 TRINITY_DN2684_c0_g2~~TRINITY_DN2684_c0_g2_i2.p1  ORF type:complete len:327 (+),score=173.33 TRINITY_DN2684_c0_g2_i2:66-1046(+)
MTGTQGTNSRATEPITGVVVDASAPQALDGKMAKARAAYASGDVEASRAAHEGGSHGEAHGGGVSDYVKSVVFGGLDGIITTFAVVAAAQGASDTKNFDVATTVLILGFANLFADGFSMGFGEYLSSRAELDKMRADREREEWEVEHSPEMEMREMEELYMEKGFPEEDAKALVAIISKDKKLFVDVMMVEELGYPAEEDDEWVPVKSAVVMFVSFITFGMVPLFCYLPQEDGTAVFAIACCATAATLFVLGAVRGYLTGQHWLKCGLFMLLNGTIAAGLSYLVGWAVSEIVDGSGSGGPVPAVNATSAPITAAPAGLAAALGQLM